MVDKLLRLVEFDIKLPRFACGFYEDKSGSIYVSCYSAHPFEFLLSRELKKVLEDENKSISLEYGSNADLMTISIDGETAERASEIKYISKINRNDPELRKKLLAECKNVIQRIFRIPIYFNDDLRIKLDESGELDYFEKSKLEIFQNVKDHNVEEIMKAKLVDEEYLEDLRKQGERIGSPEHMEEIEDMIKKMREERYKTKELGEGSLDNEEMKEVIKKMRELGKNETYNLI